MGGGQSLASEVDRQRRTLNIEGGVDLNRAEARDFAAGRSRRQIFEDSLRETKAVNKRVARRAHEDTQFWKRQLRDIDLQAGTQRAMNVFESPYLPNRGNRIPVTQNQNTWQHHLLSPFKSSSKEAMHLGGNGYLQGPGLYRP